jgi:hypothetical protein
MDYKSILTNYLSTCSGNVLDVFYEIYQILKTFDEALQPEVIMCFIDTFSAVKSDNSHVAKHHYTTKQLDYVQKKFQNKKIRKLISDEASQSSKANIAPLEFYKNVWKKLSAFCKNDREFAYALFLLIDHDLIPYRNVGIGISLSEEDYTAGAKKIRSTIFDDTMYILDLPYEQKTQRTSLLVDRLLSLDDKNLQAIYMSMILNYTEHSLKEHIKDCIDDA